MIFGIGPGLFSRPSFVFLGLAFLLFPIAHLGFDLGIPVYWSEIALGCSFLALFSHSPSLAKEKLLAILREESRFFLFAGLFIAGVTLAYGLNPHTLSDWGEIKSFYIVPALFLVAILLHAETKTSISLLAASWFLGIAAASLAALFAYVSGWLSYDDRLTSLYLSPNYLAMLVAPGLLLAAYFFWDCSRGWCRAAALSLGSLILFVLWATHSYAAWAAISVAFFTCWFSQSDRKSLAYIAPLVVAIVIIGLFIFQEYGTEKWRSLVSGSDRSSLASRLMIWHSAVKVSADSFPVGIGTGHFQEAYLANQKHFPPYLEWAVPTPHNLYLHFLIEGGVMTLVGWLGSIFLVMKRAARAFSGGTNSQLLNLGFALVIFYLVYGLVDTPYMKNDLALAVWGSFGFLLASLRIKA